jgi:O-methyltransferase involved in polyketide biosynthesis
VGSKVTYVEIDYPDIIKKKIDTIKSKTLLKDMIAEGCLESEIQIDSPDYKLFAADVRDRVLIETLLSGVRKDLPTLVLTECLLVYMKAADSELILSNFAALFPSVGFVNYEMIGPDDKFGQQMIENIEMRGCSLLGINDCPTT